MFRIILPKPRRYLLGAVASLTLAVLAAPSHADPLEQQQDNLVQKYISEQHANPLVAECAAHAVFVASTANYYDHVNFADGALDDQHAAVQPWNEPFDNGKQRIKVDTIVTVDGEGFRKTGQSTPDVLKFKCGFLDQKLLAFSYNDPLAVATSSSAHGKSSRNTRGRNTHVTTHATKAANSTHGKTAAHGSSNAKSTLKKTPLKKTPPKKTTPKKASGGN